MSTTHHYPITARPLQHRPLPPLSPSQYRSAPQAHPTYYNYEPSGTFYGNSGNPPSIYVGLNPSPPYTPQQSSGGYPTPITSRTRSPVTVQASPNPHGGSATTSRIYYTSTNGTSDQGDPRSKAHRCAYSFSASPPANAKAPLVQTHAYFPQSTGTTGNIGRTGTFHTTGNTGNAGSTGRTGTFHPHSFADVYASGTQVIPRSQVVSTPRYANSNSIQAIKVPYSPKPYPESLHDFLRVNRQVTKLENVAKRVLSLPRRSIYETQPE